MKKYMKKAFLAGGVLAGLCGVMAVAIVGADFLTRDTIAANNLAKENAGLRKVYGDSYTYSEAVSVSDSNYSYVEKYWTVTDGNAVIGRVYRGSGRNGYGEVTLLYGINADFTLAMVVTITNTESYGTTLKENYLDPLASAEDKDAAVQQVKCGATEGAKLCRAIILDGQRHYKDGGSN